MQGSNLPVQHHMASRIFFIFVSEEAGGMAAVQRALRRLEHAAHALEQLPRVPVPALLLPETDEGLVAELNSLEALAHFSPTGIHDRTQGKTRGGGKS